MLINKKKKAFTLIELLVVLSISSVLTILIGGGVISMQNSLKLDNNIRDIKSEIQLSQNTARNSFISYKQSASQTQDANNILTNGQISFGWLVTFTNNSDNVSVKVTRQSVFIQPTGSYDFQRLRDDIVNFRNLLTHQKFYCDSSGSFYSTISGKSGFVKKSTYTSVANGNVNFPLGCSETDSKGTEYFETDFSGVSLASPPLKSLLSCWDTSTNPNQQSLFFTTGYGEPVINYNASLGDTDCQVHIVNSATAGNETRSLKVSRENGVVEICGAYCS